MKLFLLLVGVFSCVLGRQMNVINKCGMTIWASPATNADGPMIDGGIQKLDPGASFAYQIPDSGWAGRLWPKIGCDDSGQNCAFGQSNPPCPPNGCQPPADTKAEFFFPANGDSQVWYDVSLVDGYSLGLQIDPSHVDDSCIQTMCGVSPDTCPTGENDVGDLRVMIDGAAVACLSPCKKWNFPPPYGLGKNEQDEPGAHYCCPTPPITVEDCRAGPIKSTQYYSLIRNQCPTAYSYAYDDDAGLHTCPSDTSFDITFCP